MSDVVRYGPTGSRGISGASRGAIPNGKWLIPGTMASHRLELDAGRLGFGPMHARIDGQVVMTFAKPDRHQPAVFSGQIIVDGMSVAVYVESRNNGDLIHADVFVNGWSLLTGQPAPVIGQRAIEAHADSDRNARYGPLRQAAMLVWIMPAMMIWRSLAIVSSEGSGSIPVGIVAAGLVAGYLGVGGAAWLTLQWLARRPDMTRGRAIAAAVAVFAIAFVASMAVLAASIVATRA